MKLTQSLGAKLAMVCAACLAAIVIGAAGMNAVSVGMLQETMRRESVRLAEEKGKQLALQLASLAESGGFEGQAASASRSAFSSATTPNWCLPA